MSAPSSTRRSGEQQPAGNGSVYTNRSSVVEKEREQFCARFTERHRRIARMVGAEMVGSSIMMFSVCGIISTTKMTQGRVCLLEYAATGGFAVILLVFTIGPISGAHVNPAITVAFAASGHFPWSKVPAYVLSQTGGSVFATYMGKVVYGTTGDVALTRPLHGWKAAFGAELIATFFIMFLAASLSLDAHLVGQVAGVAAGASISLAIMITGPISGGSMNPARSLGPAMVSGQYEDIWLYLLAPTIGAVTGAFAFRLLRAHPTNCSAKSSHEPCNVVTLECDEA